MFCICSRTLVLAVPLLVGLGISELSGTPASVPIVKEIVRALDSRDVENDARAALGARGASEVHAIAATRLRASGLLEHPDMSVRVHAVKLLPQRGDFKATAMDLLFCSNVIEKHRL